MANWKGSCDLSELSGDEKRKTEQQQLRREQKESKDLEKQRLRLIAEQREWEQTEEGRNWLAKNLQQQVPQNRSAYYNQPTDPSKQITGQHGNSGNEGGDQMGCGDDQEEQEWVEDENEACCNEEEECGEEECCGDEWPDVMYGDVDHVGYEEVCGDENGEGGCNEEVGDLNMKEGCNEEAGGVNVEESCDEEAGDEDPEGSNQESSDEDPEGCDEKSSDDDQQEQSCDEESSDEDEEEGCGQEEESSEETGEEETCETDMEDENSLMKGLAINVIHAHKGLASDKNCLDDPGDDQLIRRERWQQQERQRQQQEFSHDEDQQNDHCEEDETGEDETDSENMDQCEGGNDPNNLNEPDRKVQQQDAKERLRQYMQLKQLHQPQKQAASTRSTAQSGLLTSCFPTLKRKKVRHVQVAEEQQVVKVKKIQPRQKCPPHLTPEQAHRAREQQQEEQELDDWYMSKYGELPDLDTSPFVAPTTSEAYKTANWIIDSVIHSEGQKCKAKDGEYIVNDEVELPEHIRYDREHGFPADDNWPGVFEEVIREMAAHIVVETIGGTNILLPILSKCQHMHTLPRFQKRMEKVAKLAADPSLFAKDISLLRHTEAVRRIYTKYGNFCERMFEAKLWNYLTKKIVYCLLARHGWTAIALMLYLVRRLTLEIKNSNHDNDEKEYFYISVVDAVYWTLQAKRKMVQQSLVSLQTFDGQWNR